MGSTATHLASRRLKGKKRKRTEGQKVHRRLASRKNHTTGMVLGTFYDRYKSYPISIFIKNGGLDILDTVETLGSNIPEIKFL
jgi:hypothetical protein